MYTKENIIGLIVRSKGSSTDMTVVKPKSSHYSTDFGLEWKNSKGGIENYYDKSYTAGWLSQTIKSGEWTVQNHITDTYQIF